MTDTQPPVTHCTRCGDELDDELVQKYIEADTPTPPVMCKRCLVESVQSVAEAFAPIIREIQQTLEPALEDMADALRLTPDDLKADAADSDQ